MMKMATDDIPTSALMGKKGGIAVAVKALYEYVTAICNLDM